MSDIAIKVEGLSKQYRIGVKQERYKTLRDALTDLAVSPFRAIRSAARGSNGANRKGADDNSTVWALKDVNFEVKRGEVLGIIGRNGAGKSTLLKILSRITDPTEGQAIIQGRVGSLLEVGTGFHPELTGRENVFLNGAILGMRREEIERKFERIVDFAEVEKFVDTPVKHYSSGMYLRLAFSVAAHLESEILLVDEVLAVGDIAFQKKCLGKMEDVATEGRTVIFVSHNLGAIKDMCQTSIVLKDGSIDYVGPVVHAISRYSQAVISNDVGGERGVWKPKWHQVGLLCDDGRDSITIACGEPAWIDALLETPENLTKIRFVCKLYDASGNYVILNRVEGDEIGSTDLEAGLYRIKIAIPPLWLAPSVYTLVLRFVGFKYNAREEHLLADSDPVIVDVTGVDKSKGRAVLTPSLRWTLTACSVTHQI